MHVLVDTIMRIEDSWEIRMGRVSGGFLRVPSLGVYI